MGQFYLFYLSNNVNMTLRVDKHEVYLEYTSHFTVDKLALTSLIR